MKSITYITLFAALALFCGCVTPDTCAKKSCCGTEACAKNKAECTAKKKCCGSEACAKKKAECKGGCKKACCGTEACAKNKAECTAKKKCCGSEACAKKKADCKAMCAVGNEMLKPTPIVLPDEINSPDGMTVGKDGNIYLSINNVGDQSYPGKVGIIDANDKVSIFCDLPAHPKTGKVSPLGITFGSDGNLYIADNQAFVTNAPGMSRLLRVNIKDGKAVGSKVVATGLTMANGVSAYGDYVVVNDTAIDSEYPLKSGTYRFNIKQLAKRKKPYRVKGLKDPNLIVKLETKNKEQQVGANGVAYEAKGNMFVCNFGDAEIWKTFELLSEGKAQGLECVDGLQIDESGLLWTADFLGNAVACICPMNGKVKILAKNEPGDGADGSLDAPSESIRRGNKVYTANIDLTYGPNESDKIHTISVIELP